jgi:hypothetical protein
MITTPTRVKVNVTKDIQEEVKTIPFSIEVTPAKLSYKLSLLRHR